MKILLSTAFDKASEHSIDFAINLFSAAPFQNITYFLVHSLHVDDDQKRAQAQLEAEKARISGKVENLETYIHQGTIKHVINTCIEEKGIDLVVMGSRAKDRTQDPIVASHAMEISSHAKCSVLIIPEDIDIHQKPTSIAFGSDYHVMDVPREALLVLKNLLKAYSAKLKVFHVYEEGDEARLKKELEANVHQHFVERSDHQYFPVINHDTIEGILSFINKQKPDILTVIPRERSFIDELHHPSVTKQLSYDAKIPLLVMR